MADLVSSLLKDRDPQHLALGTYLYPPRKFVAGEPADRAQIIEVIEQVEDAPWTIHVTRGGGLFVKVPIDMPRVVPGPLDMAVWNRKQQFHRETTERFNMIVCELALLGACVMPVSVQYVLPAVIADNYAMVQQGGGSGALNLDRQLLGTLRALLGDESVAWSHIDVTLLREAKELSRARTLRATASSMPTLVASAYYHHTSGDLGEAQALSFIVTEQIVSSFWRDHLATLSGARKERLEDTRTYLLSVQLEVLLTAGRITRELYDAIHEARRPRNDLTHRAVVTAAGSEASMQAMRLLIQELCGLKVAETSPSTGIAW